MGEYIGRINVSKDTMLFIVNTVFKKGIKESTTKENILKMMPEIYEKAEVACLSRNGYLIKMAIEGAVIIQDLDNMRDFTNEINKIGVNINQIAKHINTTNNIYKSDIEELKKKIEEIYKIVESIL